MLEAYMRQETGIVFTAVPTAPAPVPAAPAASSQPETYEDALTKEVAHENAQGIAALIGQIPKRHG